MWHARYVQRIKGRIITQPQHTQLGHGPCQRQRRELVVVCVKFLQRCHTFETRDGMDAVVGERQGLERRPTHAADIHTAAELVMGQTEPTQ